MLTKSRVVQLLFMMIVLLILFFWKTFDSAPGKSVEIEQSVSPKVDLLRCDYVKACEFITEQGIFLLSVKNLPIKAEEWIDFELNTPLDNSEISKAQLVGKSMFMGRIPVTFDKSGTNKFIARALVGACTTEQMVWELQINIITADSSETLLFDFMVQK